MLPEITLDASELRWYDNGWTVWFNGQDVSHRCVRMTGPLFPYVEGEGAVTLVATWPPAANPFTGELDLVTWAGRVTWGPRTDDG